MKKKCLFTQWSVSFMAALALAGSASLGLAQQSLPAPYTFDTRAPSWTGLWWISGINVHWDGTRDANNNPNSGSVRCESPMNGTDGGCWGCVCDERTWDQDIVIDNSTGIAASLSCDICIDPSTAPTKDGDYGWFHLMLEDNVTWSMTDLGNVNIPLSGTNWTHISLPITAGSPQHFFGYVITVWGGNYTNSLAFNVDNLVLAPPPPSVQLINPSYANGAFQCTATNLTVGKVYGLQVSPDLINWGYLTFFAAESTQSAWPAIRTSFLSRARPTTPRKLCSCIKAPFYRAKPTCWLRFIATMAGPRARRRQAKAVSGPSAPRAGP